MSTVKSSSFPVLGILGIIFVVMKLMSYGAVASWSWWLVLLPFYLPLVILFGVWFIAFGFLCVATAFK